MRGVGFTASKTFTDWLHDRRRALAFTSCDGECLVVLHASSRGAIEATSFPAPVAMGLAWDEGSLYLTDRFGLWRFDLVEGHGARPTTLRAVARHFVGGVDLHEVSIGRSADGAKAIWTCATAWNALGTITEEGMLDRSWRPAFVSDDLAEDRCHLNGLALVHGQPGYVTCVSRSDVIDGWRDRRRDGGVVLDARTSEPVATGLSMPHSPRLVGDTLYVANSGAGEFGVVDLVARAFRPLAFVPGFARGLAFDDEHLLVGLSKPRAATTFGDVPLDGRLEAAGADPRCGIHLCERATGRTIGWLRIDGRIREIFDLALLPIPGKVLFEEYGAIARSVRA